MQPTVTFWCSKDNCALVCHAHYEAMLYSCLGQAKAKVLHNANSTFSSAASMLTEVLLLQQHAHSDVYVTDLCHHSYARSYLVHSRVYRPLHCFMQVPGVCSSQSLSPTSLQQPGLHSLWTGTAGSACWLLWAALLSGSRPPTRGCTCSRLP